MPPRIIIIRQSTITRSASMKTPRNMQPQLRNIASSLTNIPWMLTLILINNDVTWDGGSRFHDLALSATRFMTTTRHRSPQYIVECRSAQRAANQVLNVLILRRCEQFAPFLSLHRDSFTGAGKVALLPDGGYEIAHVERSHYWSDSSPDGWQPNRARHRLWIIGDLLIGIVGALSVAGCCLTRHPSWLGMMSMAETNCAK